MSEAPSSDPAGIEPALTGHDKGLRVARRTVAGRLLASYVVVLVAFGVTVGWSLLALRDAARDATLLREAFVPLRSSIGEALAGQNVLNAQLNHITAAENPTDVRQWIDTARRLRPLTFQEIRDDAQRGLPAGSGREDLRDHVVAEVSGIEQRMADDEGKFRQLFQALSRGERPRAERIRDDLVAAEADVAKRVRELRQRVDDEMKALTAAANTRQQRSIQLLVGLSLLTLAMGIGISIYARRVLAPLSVVRERARAVGQGDLTPREVVATDDEIGELARTFEAMVAAIQRARAELVQAERLATIGKMAAHISHEVRNPLSSISLNLELLEEELAEGGADPEAAQLLVAIRQEVERLTRITEQYLAAARRPRVQLEPESVEDLVRESHAFYGPELAQAGLRSRVEVEATVPLVALDEGQLRQALLNLLRNAREATPRGGEVVVAIAVGPDDTVTVEVKDTGPGVPEELRATIFDPFCTTKERGTGLGLAVTRAIVESHGGRISCAPRPSGGTCFRLTLPAYADPDAEGA